MTDREDALALARQTLDRGLYHGSGHITRATDDELTDFYTRAVAIGRERGIVEASDHAQREGYPRLRLLILSLITKDTTNG